MGMQPTGFMQPQPTGFAQPQQTGFMQPQPTGMSPFGNQHAVQTGFNPVPSRFSPSPSLPQQQQQQQPQPIQFNPMPPSSSPAPPTQTSSKAAQFEPGNIFSSMKDGTFAKGSVKLGPQDGSRYDALRPQPTGMGQSRGRFFPLVVLLLLLLISDTRMMTGFGGGMQPQQTGFQGQMQPQMTGFVGQQPQMYPQNTGMPQQQQQFGQQHQNGFMRQVSRMAERGYVARR